MILILSYEDDPHVDAVVRHLDARGTPYLRFDPAAFPARAAFRVDPVRGAELVLDHAAAEEARGVTLGEGRVLRLRDLDAVWLRRPGRPAAGPSIRDPFMRGYVEVESALFLQDVWESLDCPFFPARPSVMHRAELKLLQLTTAERLGLTIPNTLVTNDPPAFRAFHAAQRGQVVSKLPGPSLFRQGRDVANRYTEKVSRSDLGYASAIRHCPVAFQALVEKAFEVRATVVGDHVLAAAIHSQQNARTRVDWRRYDLDHTPHEAYELPLNVRAKCVSLLRKLGLSYGAIDFIVTPEGDHVFLEVNPNGQFLWIEQAAGLPISAAIAAWFDPPAKAWERSAS